MASTRSKNTRGNYCMEQWSLEKQAAFPVYTSARVPVESMIAGDGLVHGRMGAPNWHIMQSILRLNYLELARQIW